jgi:transposase
MSVKELKRAGVLARVKAGTLALKDAAVLVGVCYRQARRLLKRFRRRGPVGLRHRSAGRRSNRRKPAAFRRKVLKLVRTKYSGDATHERFGPTLAAEHLQQEDGLVVTPETLRRWMLADGVWSRVRHAAGPRQRRDRKAHFGELVQLDGSFEAWLEDRGPVACLMDLVDDATSTGLLRFEPQETMWGAVRSLRQWIARYGIPQALYTDWKNVYVRKPTEAERLADAVPRTQFGRMCATVGIQIIAAHSPQAKGRVERNHGTHQDRLAKKLRRRGIGDYAAANAYVEAEYTEAHNARFARPAASPEDFHTPVPPDLDLDRVFRVEEVRTLSNDWVVRYENRWLQVARQSAYAPARAKVVVCVSEDGHLAIEYRGQSLRYRELAGPPVVTLSPACARPRLPVPPRSPAPTHPWRRRYQDLPDRGSWKTPRTVGCGNGGGADAPEARAHSALEISRRARDSHIPTSPSSST